MQKIGLVYRVLLISLCSWGVSADVSYVPEAFTLPTTMVVKKESVKPISSSSLSSIASPTSSSTSSFMPEMQLVEGGTFQMGCVSGEHCEADESIHFVTLQSFLIAKTEVTFEQWDSCVKKGGCSAKPNDNGWGRGKHPIIHVSWNDAQHYTAWLSKETGDSYRLPTEAEWEYAARAGSNTAYPWGNESNYNDANCVDCGAKWGGVSTAPVASFTAFAGLYDMHGNVWEWVCSAYEADYKGSENICAKANDIRPRVIRGGFWNSNWKSLRSANRGSMNATAQNDVVGFRVVKYPLN